MLNLTWVQFLYHLKKGHVIAFTDPMFNLARDENGKVAIYVYPLWFMPFIGNRVFFRLKKSYSWLRSHYHVIERSAMFQGVILETRPRSCGVFAMIAWLMSRITKKEWFDEVDDSEK